MIKLIAFDLDGTICNSVPLCIKAFSKAVTPYLDYEITEKEIVKTFGLNEIGMIKEIVKNDWENALCDFYTYYEELHSMCNIPFSGIYELILFLKKNEKVVSLITGKGEKSCEITLKRIGMQELFDEKMYGSEKSSNKGENILSLISKYSIEKKEIIYIGDTISDIEICNQIGITCLSAAWSEKSDIYKLKLKNPNYTYITVEEITEFLKKNIT